MKKSYILLINIIVFISFLIGIVLVYYFFVFVPKHQKIYGLAYGPYREGQSPLRDNTPLENLMMRDLSILSEKTDNILIYSTADIHYQIPKMAHEAGLNCFAGAWLDNNKSSNENRVKSLISIGQSDYASALVVGAEVLNRQELSEEELINYLKLVKLMAPKIPVAYADVPKVLIEHPEVIKNSDLILADIYPFWAGVSIDAAIEYIDSEYSLLKNKYPDKEIIIGETGWPSAGDTYQKAIASEKNQARFLAEFTAWAKKKNIKYFIFEAFDESWKAKYENSPEKHWGLWQADRILKPEIEKFFEKKR